MGKLTSSFAFVDVLHCSLDQPLSCVLSFLFVMFSAKSSHFLSFQDPSERKDLTPDAKKMVPVFTFGKDRGVSGLLTAHAPRTWMIFHHTVSWYTRSVCSSSHLGLGHKSTICLCDSVLLVGHKECESSSCFWNNWS